MESDAKIPADPNQPATNPRTEPASYGQLLEEIKQRIRTAQIRAALAVNRELVLLYWEIGRSIVERQHAEGWGKSVIDRISKDLQTEFPGISGFSAQNLWYMRGFYLAWTQGTPNLQQLVGDLDSASPPPCVAGIPWGHNIQLVTKVKDPTERLWYAQKTTENGWSRSVLVHQIESDLYHRQGNTISNFQQTLPAPQSDLAQQLLKDPYTFDFLTLEEARQERDLEHGLIGHIQHFLLELGMGFAFVGRQYRLEVGGEDFYLDLLFYHLQLRCYVVIELKTGKFQPEFAGKMNFYLAEIDDLLRHPGDQPSIGLIVCKEKNQVVAEYSLRASGKPIGVSGYVLATQLPRELAKELPSVQQLRDELDTVTPQRSS